VHVGRHRRRIVQRADAHEAEWRAPAIAAPEGALTDPAPIDIVRAAALGVPGSALHPRDRVLIHHGMGEVRTLEDDCAAGARNRTERPRRIRWDDPPGGQI
jgi:hypothetical protein